MTTMPGRPSLDYDKMHGIPPRVPTSTVLWAHLLRKDTLGPPPNSGITLPPIAPVDKNGTSMRILLHDTQANFEKFSARVDTLISGVGDAKREITIVNDLFQREHKALTEEVTDLANRSQTEIQKSVGTPAQAQQFEKLTRDLEQRLESLDKRIDAIQVFNQTHSQTLQTQSQALQSLQDQHGTVLAALVPLLPLLQAIPLHIESARNSITDTLSKALTFPTPTDPERGRIQTSRSNGRKRTCSSLRSDDTSPSPSPLPKRICAHPEGNTSRTDGGRRVSDGTRGRERWATRNSTKEQWSSPTSRGTRPASLRMRSKNTLLQSWTIWPPTSRRRAFRELSPFPDKTIATPSPVTSQRATTPAIAVSEPHHSRVEDLFTPPQAVPPRSSVRTSNRKRMTRSQTSHRPVAQINTNTTITSPLISGTTASSKGPSRHLRSHTRTSRGANTDSLTLKRSLHVSPTLSLTLPSQQPVPTPLTSRLRIATRSKTKALPTPTPQQPRTCPTSKPTADVPQNLPSMPPGRAPFTPTLNRVVRPRPIELEPIAPPSSQPRQPGTGWAGAFMASRLPSASVRSSPLVTMAPAGIGLMSIAKLRVRRSPFKEGRRFIPLEDSDDDE